MDPSTLARLEEFRETKKFYDALQFCRTKITRSFRLKNSHEAVNVLVKHAFEYFLTEHQYQCAIDVIILYIESLSKNGISMTSEIFELISEIVEELFICLKKEEGNLSPDNQKLLDASCCKFIDNAIQWTKQNSSSEQEKKYGSFRLHGILANALLASQQVERSKVHFLLSDDVDGINSFLRAVSQIRQDTSEALLITETVLQILCLDRFSFAVSVFESFASSQTYPYEKPLLNFVHILFDVIQRENRDQFVELTENYQTEFKHSLPLIGYLETIGHLYFGINNAQCDAGLSSILSGLLGKQNEQKRATSHKSSVQHGKPLTTSHITGGSIAPSNSKSKNNVQFEDDLD